MTYLTPCVLGPIGVQPTTIDFIAKNAEASAAFPVGSFCHFDLAQTETSTTSVVPGFNSTWSNMRVPTTTNAYQRWAPGAVYMHNKRGEATTLAAGDEGVFRLVGITNLRIVNSAATAPSASALGQPFVFSKDADANGAVETNTAAFVEGELIIGWTQVAVPGMDSDDFPTVQTTLGLYAGFFNGLGVANWAVP